MATAAEYEALTRQVAAREFADNPALADVFVRMIRRESQNFDPRVVSGQIKSPALAEGIAQFMPDTARALGVNPLNPEQALAGAARYLKNNLSAFGGDVPKAVASYNAGPGGVARAVALGGANWQAHLPSETKLYLSIVLPAAGSAGQQRAAPLRLPAQGQITQGFGPTNEPLDAPWGGYAHFNKGIDIGAPVGTPVSAMTAGKVIQAHDSGDGWGISVKVQAADGTIHNYGHLSAAAVKVGDSVTPGASIGAVGNTGKSTGPHLSYDVWRVGQNGQPEYIDPMKYLGGQPAQGGANVTTQQTAVPGLDAEIQRLLTRNAEIGQEIATLQATLARTNSSSEKYFELVRTIELRNDEQKANASLLATYERYRPNGPNDTTVGMANVGLGYATLQQQGEQAALTAGFNFMQWASTEQRQALEAARVAKQQELANLLTLKKITLDAATAELDAWDKEQAQQIAYANAVTTRLSTMVQAGQWMAERALPAGTEYQPGFAPNDPMNAMLGRLGLPPMVVKAAAVPREWVDPTAITRQITGGQATIPAPQPFDATNLRAAAADIRSLTPGSVDTSPLGSQQGSQPTWGGQPLTPEMVAGMFGSAVYQRPAEEPPAAAVPATPAEPAASTPASTPPVLAPQPNTAGPYGYDPQYRTADIDETGQSREPQPATGNENLWARASGGGPMGQNVLTSMPEGGANLWAPARGGAPSGGNLVTNPWPNIWAPAAGGGPGGANALWRQDPATGDWIGANGVRIKRSENGPVLSLSGR